MTSVNKISSVEAIALILIITINRLVLNLPQTILLNCGSSSMLNVIFVSIISILFVLFIIKLFKRFSNLDIIDVSEFLGGNILKWIVGAFIVVYLIFISANLLRDFSEVIHILYYTDTPILYLLAFFIVVSIIANIFGAHNVVKTNVVLCSIMLISLIVSFLSVFPNITLQRALPVMGYGAYQTFFSGLVNIFSFNGLLALYLIPSMLNDKKDLKRVGVVSVIITSILLFLATASLLLSFSFSTEIEKISPLYLLISNNEFGKYFQHPESLFVFTWILSFMTYTNIACMFILRILKKLTKIKNEKPLVVPICVIVFIVSLLSKNLMQARDLALYAYKYFAGPVVFVILPIMLILANSKYKKLHKNEYDVMNKKI